MARYDLARLRAKLSRHDLQGREADLWRYSELLPIRDSNAQLCLGEGGTPLIHARRLGETLGHENLFVKQEGGNPTGSFKARGLAVAVSRAHELGVRSLSIPSAGNAAGAMSAYAAAAGMRAHVYMPASVPGAFLAECRAYGAEVTLVDGYITDCGAHASQDMAGSDRFDISTLREPYRLEGKKTMGFELAEGFRWELPEVILYPTGGGTGLIGMWKAFEELEHLGWIGARRPRMVAVQAKGCAPIVRAHARAESEAEEWQDPHTVAEGLQVPAAIGDFLMLKTLRESDGTAVSVTDDELIAGVRSMASTEGIFACPEGGATVAAFRNLKAQGWIRARDRVVLFNTGTGLKYTHIWDSRAEDKPLRGP
jgi:threonine synthase